MTTQPPVLDLVGDVGEFAPVPYGGALWVAYLRLSGQLELHRSGDAITSFLQIEVAYPMRGIAACALGDDLCLVWIHKVSGLIYFSRWNMVTRRYTQTPFSLWIGVSPKIRVYKATRLILSFVNAGGQHAYRTSADAGLSWSDPVVVDNGVTELASDVYPATENTAYWAETD